MKTNLLALMAIALLTGCASQIMQSYIGKDIREVVVDYGPPTNAFDMGDGRRAFQWEQGRSRTSPTNVSTTGTVDVHGNSAWINSNSTITGGNTTYSKCVYTMFANWNSVANGWYVINFKEPSLRCQ